MKTVSNSLISELLRLIPVVIKNLPEKQSTRLQNTVRLLNNILKRLRKISNND